MTKTNFIIIAAAVALVVAGFTLMRPTTDVKARPGGHHAAAPGPGAMAPQRIRVAPVVCLAGYVLVVPGILWGMGSHAKG
ncbi:MAG: DUF3098 domain-containing protein [Bacteroidaceae bacterium]|nr:DUF3098 domain-containing protein [Bacteroidaceae bacterium]